MTLHAYVDYMCPGCGESYVPYDWHVVCPECGTVPKTVFSDFLDSCVESCLWNAEFTGEWQLSIWIPHNIGDAVFGTTFDTLQDYVEYEASRPWHHLTTSLNHFRTTGCDEFDSWLRDRTSSNVNSDDESNRPSWWLEYMEPICRHVFRRLHDSSEEWLLYTVAEEFYGRGEYHRARYLHDVVIYHKRDFFPSYERWMDACVDQLLFGGKIGVQSARQLYEAALNELPGDGRLVRLVADLGLICLRNRDWERAILYYKKALTIYHETRHNFEDTPYVPYVTKVYKLDVCEDRRRFVGLRRYPGKDSAEQTLSDLYYGLGLAYEKLHDYDKAIEFFTQASGCVLSEREIELVARIRLPHKVCVMGNESGGFLRRASALRNKKLMMAPFLPLIGAFRYLAHGRDR